MSERVYCSDLCLASGEPLLGTAVEVDVWLLLEYKPAWKPKAVEDNDLAAPTRAWIDRTVNAYAATGLVARPQFIRRPEIDTAATSLFLARDGHLFRYECDGYGAIAALDFDALTNAAGFTPVVDPHYFICANGQRDLCCARYGLPAYARLRELVGDRAWQTTHVGGHRFAPNVLALPQGALYGRVFADDVDDFVATVETGELALGHLRGRPAYPPAAQVGETLVANIQSLQAIDGDAVTFGTADGLRTVHIRQADAPLEVLASCGKTETETVIPLLVSSG